MTDEKQGLLVVEDDSGLRTQMKWALKEYDVYLAMDKKSALDTFGKVKPSVVVLDLGLPPDSDGVAEGLSTLESILSFNLGTKIIIASGNDEIEHAVKAINLGAYDFLAKPVEIDVMRLIIERAFYLANLEKENQRLMKTREKSPLTGIIAASKEMLEISRTIEQIAPSNVSVLLTGESGVGKELLAQAIHELSDRSSGPFVVINGAAIPENLLESELFGHEKGAFTGAIKRVIGKVERADNGTLFIDEIGDMPLSLQTKLLRFLQERKFERVGGSAEISVDLRIITATNRELKSLIKSKEFREDLFYRINEFNVEVPPLRDREGDAVILAKYFVQTLNDTLSASTKGFSDDALSAISEHHWPGNVRELENRMKRAVILADGRLITTADLDLESIEFGFRTLRESRDRADKEIVLKALTNSDNNLTEAAKLLGVSRPTLYALLERFSLRK